MNFYENASFIFNKFAIIFILFYIKKFTSIQTAKRPKKEGGGTAL